MHFAGDISRSRRMWLLTAFLAFHIQDVLCLKLEAVLVPQYKFRGQNATLLCKYDLDKGEELFSLKWYKQETEFYRFTPQTQRGRYNNYRNTEEFWHNQRRGRKGAAGDVKTWRLPGIRIDEENSSSNGDSVVLKKVTFKSTGIYRCEVTTKVEGGQWVVKESTQKMVVVELPDSTPVISGSDPRKSLKAGDILNLTCTSKPSNPAAQLEWTLNGKSVESNSPQKQIDVGRGLVSTKTDLYMRLEESHFKNGGGSINVKCKGTIAAEFWQRDADVNIYTADSPDNSFVQVLGVHEANWPGGAGSVHAFQSVGLLLALTCLLICAT